MRTISLFHVLKKNSPFDPSTARGNTSLLHAYTCTTGQKKKKGKERRFCQIGLGMPDPVKEPPYAKSPEPLSPSPSAGAGRLSPITPSLLSPPQGRPPERRHPRAPRTATPGPRRTSTARRPRGSHASSPAQIWCMGPGETAKDPAAAIHGSRPGFRGRSLRRRRGGAGGG
jgi:hypothetical protein